MITSYEVGSVYRIVDQATPTLIKIAGLLEKIAGLSKDVEARFSGLAAVKLGQLTKGLGSLEKSLSVVAEKASAAGNGLTAGFQRADVSIAATTKAIEKLTAELAAAKAEAAGLRLPPPGGGGRPNRPGQGGGSGGHGSPSSAGHTGVQLGVMGFFGAEAIGHGLKEVLKDAGELEHVQQQMVQAGFKQTEIAKANAAAWAEAQKYGISVSKVMGDIKELTLPLGSIEHAIDFIGPLEKMRVVLNAVSEGRGTSSADAVYKMARAGELKGLQTPEEFSSYFDNMTKVISASGGKVTPNDFMQFAKYGKLSTMGFSEDFFTKYAPTLMQTMGASTAGTAAQSLFGTLVQGTVSKRALGRMDALGLIEDPSKVIYDNKGDPKGFNPGAIAGTEMLVKNPFEWAQKVLLPLLEKKYGDISNTENKQKAIEDLGGLFGNRNSAAAIAELALRGKTFNKDAGLIDQARGIGGADAMLQEDPKAVAEKLHGAWTNLMTALGGPGVKVAVEGMNSLATGITSLTKWANENPGTTKIILEAFVGLGAAFAALTVAGAVAGAVLLAPGGAIAVAVASLIGIMGSLAAFNWDALKEIGTKIRDALMAPVDAIMAMWEKLKSLNPFSKTSFEGGEGGIGGMIQKASYGGANDNFSVGRVLGGGGGGRDVSGGRSVGSDDPSLTNRARESWSFWKSKGLSDAAAAGLLGMEQGENNFSANGGMFKGWGDRGAAYGTFMWHKDRRNRILRETGINVVGASHQKQLEAAFHEMTKGGESGFWDRIKGATSPGHGAALGVYGFERPADKAGAARLRGGYANHWYNKFRGSPEMAAPAAPPPTAGPPPRQPQMVEAHLHTHLDGRQIAKTVTRHQVADSRFPTSIGGMDTHGSWRPPGTQLTDAA
jgi:hypothetical protein